MSWLTDLLGWLSQRPAPPAPVPPTPPQPAPAAVAAELLGHVNAARAAAGRAPLNLDSRLAAAAGRHAAQMYQKRIMAHDLIGDGTPAYRVAAAGYRWCKVAENVALGQPDPAAVFASWMNSPGHRANILGAYADFGGDVAGSYWCAVFASPAV
jgi:uncharacterized protein YkwD